MGKSANEGKDEAQTKTCFVIMPISDVEGYPVGHFNEVYKQLIEPAVTAAGYACSLATSTSAAHMIQLEVVTKVATADLCICDLSTNNPNVLFEYGIRQAFDKPTVLLKDNKTHRIFDLSGFRDIEYDHTLRIANTLSTRDAIRTAILDTVSGANDDNQVFSLVKLMKLTKAALPPGELDRDDARFELLEMKFDRLAAAVPNRLDARTTTSFADRYLDEVARAQMQHGPYQVTFFDDAVKVTDKSSRKFFVYRDSASIEKSPYYLALSTQRREHFDNLLAENSPNLIPF